MTVVVVVISFSIVVSCTFVSLLLVTVGIVYNMAGSSSINPCPGNAENMVSS
jgi:hypothetical protein